MADGNGKWQIAFWVVTLICGVWLIGITSAVVSNDRIRASEDQRVECKVGSQYSDIIQRLTRIETKIERSL